VIYAVGDIHGELGKLEALIAVLPVTPEDRVVFLGDYVDRGPHAKGVVDRLIALAREWPCTFLLGNHESMFLDFIGWRGERYGSGEFFLANGGIETLLSYGVRDFDAVEREGLALPPEHERFFKELRLWHLEGEYAFVHAGLSKAALGLSDPKYALSREHARDLLWQRETADLPHSLGVTVVYGHTPLPDFGVRWNVPYSIGIDTGAVYGGPLSAIRLPDETIFQS
jgi:serine/threonine protein phosphatase 1